MANENFNTGLFTQTPATPRRFTPPTFGGSNPFGAAASAIGNAGTQFAQQDAFAPLANTIRKRQRMGALARARSEGLKPEDGEKYYSRVRDLLQEAGDMQGAEQVEARRVAEEKRRVDIEKTKADTEKTKIDTERTEGIVRGRLDERGVEVDERTLELKEEELEFEQEKLDKTLGDSEADRKSREQVAQINANASTDAALIRSRGLLNAELAKQGIVDDIDSTDINVAGNQFQFHLNKRLDGTDVENDNFMQLWSEYALGIGGTELKNVIKDLNDSDAPTRKAAERVMASIHQQIAMNEKLIAAKHPGMPQAERLNLATLAGPGARFAVDPNTGKRVMVSADNETVIVLP